jgi:hypothetical protein
MADDDSSGDVLMLDQELLLGGDAGGDEAFPMEPDVLLLDTPMFPAGPIITVELEPGRYSPVVPEPRFGRGLRDESTDSGATSQSAPTVADPAPQLKGLEYLLEAARQSAEIYKADEARTRKALYATLAGAYDLSLAMIRDPAGFARIRQRAGLKMQDRAPMTAVLKLVFGQDFDKARLTEYAAVLAHGQRELVPPGGFLEFLAGAQGGLKGLVLEERARRRGEEGRTAAPRTAPRREVAERLRKLCVQSLHQLESEGDEFTLVILRRTPDGAIGGVSEVPRDVALLERAARRQFEDRERDGRDRPGTGNPQPLPRPSSSSTQRTPHRLTGTLRLG